jgi:hypothetical protein
MNTKHIEAEALLLPAEDRARLALELLESLEDLPESELETLWLSEARRRSCQLDANEAELIPSDVVAREARALIER